MDSQTALKLSYMENDDAELSGADRLRLAKRIFEINNLNKSTPFFLSNQDINFLKIFEILDLSDRERDIMFITTFYHTCYIEYNITINIMKEGIPQVAVDRLLKMYDVLNKYGILNFLFTDGKVMSFEEFKKSLWIS